MARERDQQQKGAGTADIADLGGDVFKVAQQKIVGTSGSGAGGGGGGKGKGKGNQQKRRASATATTQGNAKKGSPARKEDEEMAEKR